MENKIDKILAIGAKVARVQDSCQNLGQVSIAMQYTQLAKQQIQREISLAPTKSPISRVLGKLGFK